MRFQLAAARLAFAAFSLAALTAAAAVVGVHLGALPDASGSFLMIPATALGVAATAAALLWLRAALRSNLGTGKRLGLIALIGSLLFLAGLETTAMILGFAFRHFADHDDDRRRLVSDPEVTPLAVEELMRVYSTNFVVGRLVAILVLVAIWAVVVTVRHLRSSRASNAIAEEIVAQSPIHIPDGHCSSIHVLPNQIRYSVTIEICHH